MGHCEGGWGSFGNIGTITQPTKKIGNQIFWLPVKVMVFGIPKKLVTEKSVMFNSFTEPIPPLVQTVLTIMQRE